MQAKKRRLEVYLEADRAREVERLAGVRKRSLSDTAGYLLRAGLESEAHTEMAQLTRAIEAISVQLEQLQDWAEGHSQLDAERFRRVLGHLQINQALVAEAVACQRVTLLEDRPEDYSKAVDLARRQATEDAGHFRDSIAIAGPRRVDVPGVKGRKSA